MYSKKDVIIKIERKRGKDVRSGDRVGHSVVSVCQSSVLEKLNLNNFS